MLVWSYGGGTQSAAIAALILTKKLPTPDIIVMADTGREVSETWDYLDDVISPALADIGLAVNIINQEWGQYGLMSSGRLLPPFYTRKNGRIGRFPMFCSSKWKQRPIRRWLRAQGVTACDMWLGISMDEAERMRPSGVRWLQHIYPLIELRPTYRRECYTLVERMGWPRPPKSRCWMCPNMSPQDWRELKERYPGDFENAIELEQHVQRIDPNVYLHSAAIPLADAVDKTTQQLYLFDSCDSGFCFV